MAKVIKRDPLARRKVNMDFGVKVRCTYPRCTRTFVPVGATKVAYMKKGYCYCHEHQALMAAYYATR